MIKFNNEKGITLVEVLAVLLISSILGVILYSIVILTMNYNTVETTKTSLQQEANYIVTDLQRVHRHTDCYLLSIEHESIKIVINCNQEDENLNNPRIISDKFQFTESADEIIYQVFPHGIHSKKNDGIDILESIDGVTVEKFYGELPLELSVMDKRNNVSVDVSTVLTRLYN